MKETIEENLQLAIRDKIDEVGLTVTEIAHYCEVSPVQLRSVVEMESGMSLKFAAKVCKKLGVSIDKHIEVRKVKPEIIKREIITEKLNRRIDGLRKRYDQVIKGEGEEGED